MDDGTFPALLKTLSDTSEEVIKHDLQLLAQISSTSDDSYFKAFMINLLDLFSTDRRLLETRGSLIIRQLCLNLSTERIYKTFAEILEKEEVWTWFLLATTNLRRIARTLTLLASSCKSFQQFSSRRPSLPTFADG
jgi:vacuole morphology and inheritance protein 14